MRKIAFLFNHWKLLLWVISIYAVACKTTPKKELLPKQETQY